MSQEERQGIRQAQRQQLEEKIAQEAHEKAQENACTTLQTAAATMLQRELLQVRSSCSRNYQTLRCTYRLLHLNSSHFEGPIGVHCELGVPVYLALVTRRIDGW